MFVTVIWTVKRWVFPINAISFHPQYYLEMNAPTSKKIIFVGFPNYQNYLWLYSYKEQKHISIQAKNTDVFLPDHQGKQG